MERGCRKHELGHEIEVSSWVGQVLDSKRTREICNLPKVSFKGGKGRCDNMVEGGDNRENKTYLYLCPVEFRLFNKPVMFDEFSCIPDTVQMKMFCKLE